MSTAGVLLIFDAVGGACRLSGGSVQNRAGSAVSRIGTGPSVISRGFGISIAEGGLKMGGFEVDDSTLKEI